jgi:hypothetical protein
MSERSSDLPPWDWLSTDPELLSEGYTNRPEPDGDDDGDWRCAKCFAQYGAAGFPIPCKASADAAKPAR